MGVRVIPFEKTKVYNKPPLAIECKNCGAPLRGDVCEYCGSVYKLRPTLEELEELQRLRQQELAIANIQVQQQLMTMKLISDLDGNRRCYDVERMIK